MLDLRVAMQMTTVVDTARPGAKGLAYGLSQQVACMPSTRPLLKHLHTSVICAGTTNSHMPARPMHAAASRHTGHAPFVSIYRSACARVHVRDIQHSAPSETHGAGERSLSMRATECMSPWNVMAGCASCGSRRPHHHARSHCLHVGGLTAPCQPPSSALRAAHLHESDAQRHDRLDLQ